MANLATVDDVAISMMRPLTPQEEAAAEQFLALASRLFRKASGQDFELSTTTTRLKCNPSSIETYQDVTLSNKWRWARTVAQVFLPQRPIVEVTEVVDDYGDAVEYELYQSWLFVAGYSASDFLRVTYSHGYEDIPAEVVAVVAGMVARALSIPDQARGGASAIQETTGPFTTQVQFAKWASGGGVQLSPADREVAEMYRVSVPTTWVNNLR